MSTDNSNNSIQHSHLRKSSGLNQTVMFLHTPLFHCIKLFCIILPLENLIFFKSIILYHLFFVISILKTSIPCDFIHLSRIFNFERPGKS